MSYEIQLDIKAGTKVAQLFQNAAAGSTIPCAPAGSRLELSHAEQDVRGFSDLISGAPVTKVSSSNGVETYKVQKTWLSEADVRGTFESTCPWDYPKDAPPAVNEVRVLMDGRLIRRCVEGREVKVQP